MKSFDELTSGDTISDKRNYALCEVLGTDFVLYKELLSGEIRVCDKDEYDEHFVNGLLV